MGTKSSFTIVTANYQYVTGLLTTNAVDKIRLDKSRSGSELPNHKQVISDGGNATTSLTAFEESIVLNIPGSFEGLDLTVPTPSQRVRKSNKLGFQLFKPAQTVSNSTINYAVARATSKAFDKIRQTESPFQGQIFLGELRRTVDMLKSPLEKSVRLTEALLAKRKKFRNVAEAAADSWLEYRFGILPLVTDVNAILKLAADVADKSEILTHRCYGKDETSSTISSTPSDVYGFKLTTMTSLQHKAECIIRFGIMQKHLEQHATFSSRLMNSVDDLSSIPVTAWELVPYSFLIDYFVNIGDIIEASTTGTSHLSYQSRSIIRTTLERRESVSVVPINSSYQLISFSPRVLSVQRRDVVRDGTVIGIPPMVFSLPGSNIRYANIAALLTNLNRRS